MSKPATIQTPESIKAILTDTSEPSKLALANMAVEKALIVLYERQTADEQASEATKHVNGMGFNAFDAEILSSFACQINQKLGQHSDYLGRPRKLGECLSAKQMELARKKVVRYAKQLAEVANSKLPATVAEVKPEPAKAALVMAGGEETDGEPVDAYVSHYDRVAQAQASRSEADKLNDEVLASYEALQAARQALAQERKLKVTYYNGRRTVDIAQERVEELEAKHNALLNATKGGYAPKAHYMADPEHREFRDSNAKLKAWLAR